MPEQHTSGGEFYDADLGGWYRWVITTTDGGRELTTTFTPVDKDGHQGAPQQRRYRLSPTG